MDAMFADDTALGSHATHWGRRILIIAQDVPVPIDQHVWRQALALNRNGYIVSVISPKGRGCNASYEKRDGIALFRYTPANPAKTLVGRMLASLSSFAWKFLLACRAFFTHGFDAVHICNPPDMVYLIGGFFKVFFNKIFVFEQRVALPERYENNCYRRDMTYRLLLRMEALAFNTAEISIVADEFLHEAAISRSKMNPQKLFTVPSYPVVPLIKDFADSSGEHAKKKLRVTCIGTFGSRNQIERFIAVARILVHEKKRHDIRFLAVCPESLLMDMQKLAAIENIPEHLSLQSADAEQPPDEIMLKSDIGISLDPANYSTGYSGISQMLDYMASGRPVIACDTPEARRIGKEACLYATAYDPDTFAECIISLADNPEKRNRIGREGYEYVAANFNWNSAYPALLAAYAEVFKTAAS